MQTILLVAGQSTRFWPLSEKSLFPVCGKSRLEWQLSRLHEAGITDITVVANAENETLVRALVPDLPLVVQQDMSMGTRGAILSALPALSGGPVMIVSGNDLVEAHAFKDLLAAAATPGVDGVFLAKEMQTYFPGGYLSVEGNHITGIVEKPEEGAQPSNLVNIIIHVHNDRAALEHALANISDPEGDGYSQTEQTLLAQKHYEVVRYMDSWHPAKYPWHLLDTMEEMLKGITKTVIHPTARVHETAVVEGPVIIEEGAQVLAHAIIVGPVYIGKHATIGYHSIIRGGSIGAHCVIGGRSEIKASVLHRHVWTHGTYIGDSVIGENVSFGTGCVVGNLRLDEGLVSSMVHGKYVSTCRIKFGTAVGNDVRIGMQVGINPGVKIGSGSLIAGSMLLEEDIPEDMFVRMKDGVRSLVPNKSPVPLPEARDQFREHGPKKG